MKRNQVIGGVVVFIIVAGVAFYAGDAYAKSHATPNRTAFAGGQFGLGQGNFAGRAGMRTGADGGFTAGQVVSFSNGSISIKQQNGSSTEIVLISPSTQILKQATGSVSDLSVGTEVTVTGTSNSDGSLSASSIQIRPAGMHYPGGARTNSQPASVQ